VSSIDFKIFSYFIYQIRAPLDVYSNPVQATNESETASIPALIVPVSDSPSHADASPTSLGSSVTKFLNRMVKRSASLKKPRRSKAAPPLPETTPVAKRTRSLKRAASFGDIPSLSDESPYRPVKSPDKTLLSLKAKAKKLKQKLSPS
jgi:hypothetical protein